MMPSDYLSSSEKKELSGEIAVYELNKPVSYSKFKSWPPDIQTKYLTFLRDEFDATETLIAVNLFKITSQTLSSYVHDRNLLGIFSKSGRTSSYDRDRFIKWADTTKDVKPTENEKMPKTKTVAPVIPMFYNVIASCEMILSGKASEISQMLFNMFQDQNISVTIVFDGPTVKVGEADEEE